MKNGGQESDEAHASTWTACVEAMLQVMYCATAFVSISSLKMFV